MNIWKILGNLEPDVASRVKANNELSEDSLEGRKRRAQLRTALEVMDTEEHGLGIEMNQRYTSAAVFKADQGEMPTFDTDPLKHYHATTYPGARVPHVWVNSAVPSRRVSTIDLAGKGKFALLTGIGGQKWKAAADEISSKLNIPIAAYSIGYGQDYEDIYLDWARIRGVDESGCILVRPDYFVAWRSQQWEEDSASKLLSVLKSVLSLS